MSGIPPTDERAGGSRPRRRAGGFTLLEVLVALGIIVGALAGIAALLPAVGSRLADATEADRSGTLSANARAELANRGLTTPLLWRGVDPPISTPAVVFGQGLPSVATIATATASIAPAVPGVVSGRIDVGGGFFLRDVLEVQPPATVTGFEPGICYGCMLSSTSVMPADGLTAGSAVRLTTVIFRNPEPDVKEFTLTQTGSDSTVFTSGSGADAAADRRRFLSGCSWLLVVSEASPPADVPPPRWFPVASSWTAYPPGAAGEVTTSATGASYLSLSGTEWRHLLSSTSTLRAFGFEGLLTLDERIVTLE